MPKIFIRPFDITIKADNLIAITGFISAEIFSFGNALDVVPACRQI